jgi:hypothetical protein
MKGVRNNFDHKIHVCEKRLVRIMVLLLLMSGLGDIAMFEVHRIRDTFSALFAAPHSAPNVQTDKPPPQVSSSQ